MTELFIYRTAMAEFLRLRKLLVWVLIAIGGAALANTWKDRGGTPDAIYAQISEVMVFKVLALASAVFTTSIISQEVEQKTIAYLLTRPIDRWRLLISRFFASVTIVILLGLFGSSAIAFTVYGSGFLSSPVFWRDVPAIILSAFAYGSLFLFVSLVVNKAMIVCLLFAFGWETLAPTLPGEIYYLSIFSYTKAIADHPAGEVSGPFGALAGNLNPIMISKGTAFAVLILLTVVLLAMAAWWFTTFEYVPREDVA